MTETPSLPYLPHATPSLQALLACTKKLAFRGPESISRLKALNRLAHEAAQASLQRLLEEDDDPKEEELSSSLRCFVLNQHSLKGLEILTGSNSEIGFGKIKNRLMENIRFFLEQEKAVPVRQDRLVEA